MIRRAITLLSVPVLLGVLCIAGCAKEEGTSEEAGKEMDNAATQTDDAAKKAGEEMKDATGGD